MDLSTINFSIDERTALEGRAAPIQAEDFRCLPRAPADGLAMSLERRRLRLYLVLVLADALIVLVSFALAIISYQRVLLSHDAMRVAYLLLPLYLTIALYSGTYNRPLYLPALCIGI